LGEFLTGFAGWHQLSCIIDHYWPLESLSKDISC
jgi:hypothetical protein